MSVAGDHAYKTCCRVGNVMLCHPLYCSVFCWLLSVKQSMSCTSASSCMHIMYVGVLLCLHHLRVMYVTCRSPSVAYVHLAAVQSNQSSVAMAPANCMLLKVYCLLVWLLKNVISAMGRTCSDGRSRLPKAVAPELASQSAQDVAMRLEEALELASSPSAGHGPQVC